MPFAEPVEVSAARIVALGLVGDRDRSPQQVVEHLGCAQAQDLPGALLSIALRTASRDLANVIAAFDDGTIVRSWTQRGTIHAVPARDLGWVLSLTGRRILQATARRRAVLGIDDAMIDRATGIALETIASLGPISRTRLIEAWAELGVDEVPGRAYHLITVLCHRGVLVQGPFAKGTGRTEQLFVALTDWVTEPVVLSRDEALARWLGRYAASHGPVTLADAARWTGLTTADCRLGLAAAESDGALASIEIDGTKHWLAAGALDDLAEHRKAAEELLLLPGFDELILGYKDRSATLSREHERLVVPGGNGMFKATLVQRCRVRGTWRRGIRKSDPPVLVEPFPGERIDKRAVERAGRRLPAAVPVSAEG